MYAPIAFFGVSESRLRGVSDKKPTWRRGCLGCGCLTLGVIALIILQLPMLAGACRARAAVRPGMSVAEVFERSRGYFVCTLTPKPKDSQAPPIQVFGLTLVDGDKREPFSSTADLGRAIEERMKQRPGPWVAGFGYITTIPRRTYCSVEFGPDARVSSVSDTWAGTAD
jgi:hypothetical protein